MGSSSDPLARVKMPSTEMSGFFQATINKKHRMMQDFYAVSDILGVRLEKRGDAVVQEIFYNGRTHDQYAGNVVVNAPSGAVIACAVNALGCMQDLCIAKLGSAYDILKTTYERTGRRGTVDSAIARGQYSVLRNSVQHDQGAEGARDIMQTRQATSVQQAS